MSKLVLRILSENFNTWWLFFWDLNSFKIGDWRYIYTNELDKVCLYHDAVHVSNINVNKGTVTDKVYVTKLMEWQ